MARRDPGLRLFPNVSSFKDRHGKPRYRYRAKGQSATYLPGVPGSPEFAEAYSAAIAGLPRPIGASRTVPGSINALAVVIYASAEWEALAPATRRTYRGILEQLREAHGDRQVKALDVAICHRLRDRKKATPTAANNLIKVLRWALEIAITRGMIGTNPALSVRPLPIRSDGHHTWTETEIAAFEERWPVGTRERLAFDLYLYTGQRLSDVRGMGRQHVRGDRIMVRQQKTKAVVDIPIHQSLKASLDTVPADQMVFILTNWGEPYSEKGIGNWFGDASRAAGLVRCSAHGLRKAMGRRLAEAGCTTHEIAAVLGHTTLKEVERYTRDAQRHGLATSALSRIGGTENEQILANPADRVAKSARKLPK